MTLLSILGTNRVKCDVKRPFYPSALCKILDVVIKQSVYPCFRDVQQILHMHMYAPIFCFLCKLICACKSHTIDP